MNFFKILILLILFTPSLVFSQKNDLFGIAVVVNNEIVTNYEISQRILLLQAFGEKDIKKNKIINDLIDEKLYSISASELNIIPKNSEIENALIKLSQNVNLKKNQLIEYLKLKKVSYKTLILFVKSKLEQQKVIQTKFVNTIKISDNDVDLAIRSDEFPLLERAYNYEFIKLSFLKSLNYESKTNILNSIDKDYDNCSDLKSVENKYADAKIKIFKTEKDDISKNMLLILDKLDINENVIVSNTDNIFMLTLCSRKPKISQKRLKLIRNKIYKSKINILASKYINTLRNNALVEIK